jgi:DNA-binding MarR family transcriptional regulator
LTRLVDRLVRDGMVARIPCESDGRAMYAVLTDAGLARFRGAAPTHLRGIRQHFLSRLSADQQAALRYSLDQLLD